MSSKYDEKNVIVIQHSDKHNVSQNDAKVLNLDSADFPCEECQTVLTVPTILTQMAEERSPEKPVFYLCSDCYRKVEGVEAIERVAESSDNLDAYWQIIKSSGQPSHHLGMIFLRSVVAMFGPRFETIQMSNDQEMLQELGMAGVSLLQDLVVKMDSVSELSETVSLFGDDSVTNGMSNFNFSLTLAQIIEQCSQRLADIADGCFCGECE